MAKKYAVTVENKNDPYKYGKYEFDTLKEAHEFIKNCEGQDPNNNFNLYQFIDHEQIVESNPIFHHHV